MHAKTKEDERLACPPPLPALLPGLFEGACTVVSLEIHTPLAEHPDAPCAGARQRYPGPGRSRAGFARVEQIHIVRAITFATCEQDVL